MLATPGESRTTALERQKQLYTKRRTEVVTGGALSSYPASFSWLLSVCVCACVWRVGLFACVFVCVCV